MRAFALVAGVVIPAAMAALNLAWFAIHGAAINLVAGGLCLLFAAFGAEVSRR